MKYNYWVIYVLPEYIEYVNSFSPYNNDYIYAYTDEKELLDNFISLHDMKKFMIKKYKLEKTDCSILNKKYQNRYMRMVDVITNDNGKATTIKIAMSIEEKNLLDNTRFSFMYKIQQIWDLMTFGLKEPTLNLFNKKYKKLLRKFKLDLFVVNINLSEDMDFAFNEFAIYYSLFNKLLKK